jgi:plasmid stabilization system protein ParE
MATQPVVTYTRIARAQIAHISIDERFSVDARRQKIVAILAACRDCAAFPYRYPAGKLKGTRERRVRPFKIIYRIVEDGVEILAIWHERQSRTMPPESQ